MGNIDSCCSLEETVSFMFTASYESSEIILVAEDSMYMWILLEFSHIWLAKKKKPEIYDRCFLCRLFFGEDIQILILLDLPENYRRLGKYTREERSLTSPFDCAR